MTLEFTMDPFSFYLDQKPFVPVVQDSCDNFDENGLYNAAIVRLSLDPGADLNWSSEIARARHIIEKKGLIVWELDFGFSIHLLSITDRAFFSSLTLALDHFSQTILKDFESATLALIFYRGDANFSSHIVWDEEQNENFCSWREDYPQGEEKQLKEIYAGTVFAEYLHRLLSFLPDYVQAICLFSYIENESLLEFAQKISKERFSHFLIAVKDSPFYGMGIQWESGNTFGGVITKEFVSLNEIKDVSIGICLPSDDHLFSCDKDEIEQVFSYFTRNNIPCRIICESMLTQDWAGLEAIVVFEKVLSLFGKRQLQGFCAASGLVITCGNRLNLTKEISFEEFDEKNRSRGIRTPDLLLPKQPR